ncbi:MAG: hypothetical protein Q7T54_01720 [Candidatus Levybacteria bacterium]|nr:hypothetical protein [Candidatus Levybacteria bacterium]
MQPTTDTDYKKLFSQLVKKQILVLGPDITLAKVRNVEGLTVDNNGEVMDIKGDPQVLLQGLINQFVELSGMIVKKTMESILTSYPGMAGFAAGSMAMAVATPVMGGMPAQTSPQAIADPIVVTPNTDTSVPTVTPVNSTQPMGVSASNEDNSMHSESKPQIEPPTMSQMNLTSLAPATNKSDEKPVEKGPSDFSSDEMAELNKALEQLSKAPLSTETPAVASVTPA